MKQLFRGVALVIAAAVIISTMSFVGLLAHRLWPGLIERNIEILSGAIHGAGVAGWIALTVINIVIVASGLLPASLFGALAGAIFGAYLGFLLSSVSTMVGALLSFWLSRSMFRPAFASLLKNRPRIENLDTLIAGDGWKTVCLLRLSPILPFAATSYCLGLSSIGQRDYLLGTLAALPSLLGYVLIGAFTQSAVTYLDESSALFRVGLLGLGAIMILLAMAHVARLIKRAETDARRRRNNVSPTPLPIPFGRGPGKEHS